jgi:hypothetical protein
MLQNMRKRFSMQKRENDRNRKSRVSRAKNVLSHIITSAGLSGAMDTLESESVRENDVLSVFVDGPFLRLAKEPHMALRYNTKLTHLIRTFHTKDSRSHFKVNGDDSISPLYDLTYCIGKCRHSNVRRSLAHWFVVVRLASELYFP